MTTRDLDKFFKKASKVIDNYEGKLKILDYDYFIISNVIFTSDKDYYYLFSVFKDNKVIDKVVVNDSKDYDKTFKDLSIKYKTNVIYNYNDLAYTQLCYLDSLDDRHLNKEEISSIILKRQLDIF
jgi:hypothetical protein